MLAGHDAIVISQLLAQRLFAAGKLDLAGRVCDGWLTYLPGGLADDYSLMAEAIAKTPKSSSLI